VFECRSTRMEERGSFGPEHVPKSSASFADPISRLLPASARSSFSFKDAAASMELKAAAWRDRASATLASLHLSTGASHGAHDSLAKAADAPRVRSSSSSRPNSSDGVRAPRARSVEACAERREGDAEATSGWPASLGVHDLPRFPTVSAVEPGTKSVARSAARRNKLPLAWALSDQLATSFWERQWARRNGSSTRDRRRVLILMSETGGGHKASATSVAEALEEISKHTFSEVLYIVALYVNIYVLGH
jgi:hypothetical protein